MTEVSAVFNEYKEIYNSSVAINGMEVDMYRLTTEGVQLKEPGGYVSVTVSAEVRGDDGSNLGDSFSLSLLNPAEIPSVEELKERVKAFAEGLMQLKAAPPVAEYYNGPILFEGGAVATILANNLLYRGGLIAARSLMPMGRGLADQFGQKIMDERLTVKNYTNKKEYNGTPLYGYYEVDGDGVTPEAEMVLVEKGVFKKMLNGRIPALKAPETTGSSRFIMSPQSPTLVTGTGTIHVPGGKGRCSREDEKVVDQGGESGRAILCLHRERYFRVGTCRVPGGLEGRERDPCPDHGFPYAGADKIVEAGCHLLEGRGNELLAERLPGLDDLPRGDDRGRHGDREG